ncbi:MAG TPA: prolipoprotein diacylglyceryl transferase family protein [Planctomycetota bacterium]|nr:prolipoprotein diacylglyceryl transferase family protein [Planctomycetota bacterium]
MKGSQAYAIFQLLALLAAGVLRKRSTLPWRQRLAVLTGALAGAGLGAKLPFVLLSAEPFWSMQAWFTDGKTILSGLAGGYLGVEIAKALSGIREKQGDTFAMPLAAAVAIGRWGCFFNGCCGAPLVPPIESAFHALMAILLWKLSGIEALRWQLLKLYLIAYSGFRFLIEFVRTEPRIALGLTPYQFGSAALAGVMALLWWRDERLKRTLSGSTPTGTLQG